MTALRDQVTNTIASLKMLLDLAPDLDGDQLTVTTNGPNIIGVHNLTAAQLAMVARVLPRVERRNAGATRWLTLDYYGLSIAFHAQAGEWRLLDQHERVVAAPGPGSRMVAPDESA